MNTNRDEIKKIIDVSNNFLIILSQADEDSIASGITLKHILESNGKRAKAIHYEKISKKFDYIPYINEVEIINPSEIDYKEFDAVIVVDAGSLKQIVGIEKVEGFSFPKDVDVICIDHHLGNTAFANHYIYESTASSATELVYKNFVEQIDGNKPFMNYELKKDEATLFLIGIVDDTGFFRWSVSEDVFLIAKNLIKNGADMKYITNYLHYNKDISLFKFLKYSLNIIEFYPDIHFMLLTLNDEDIKNIGLNIKEVYDLTRDFHEMITCAYKDFDCGGIIIQNSDRITGTFRGNGYTNKVNLNELCSHITKNGGGHFNAAGFDIKGKFSSKDVKEYKLKVVDKVKELFNNK